MQTECRMATNPQTMSTNLHCEPASKGYYHVHPPSPFIIIIIIIIIIITT